MATGRISAAPSAECTAAKMASSAGTPASRQRR